MVVSTNLLPNGKQQYFDGNGNPLASGKVYFYVPNTTTFKNTWQDPERVSLNTNPVQLDLNGEAVIFGDGIYRQVLKDVNGVEIWDELSIQFITVGGDLSGQLPNPTVNPALFIAQFNTNKNPPVDNDRFLALDSGAALAPIYFLWSQIKSAMQTALEAIFDLRYAQNTNIGPGLSGLVVTVTSNSQVTITARRLVAFTGAGAAQVGNALTLTADLSTSGTNGLDTGAEAASTWYNVWAIYNPTTATWASLLSLSVTAPTLPSGYTYKVRLGAIRNDGSSNLLRTLQKGALAHIVIGTNPALLLPVMGTGPAGTITSGADPVWAAIAVGNFVPPTASEIRLILTDNYNNGADGCNIYVAPNQTYSAHNCVSTKTPPWMYTFGDFQSVGFADFMPLESTNIYWAASAADGALYCAGWIDEIG